jgi:predicted phage-related endonuclease
MLDNSVTARNPTGRRSFIGGSDARIIMGDDEAALLRLWREKRGEIEPEDLSGNLIVLDLEDAKEFGRRLVEAVHCARTQMVVTTGIRITINVVANGYHLQFGDMNNATELFLDTNCIWRVCQGLLRIADLIAPVESN